MKAIVKTQRAPGIDVLDVDAPDVGETDILVRVLAGSLCGSDVHIYEWTPGYEWMPIPLILGHEFSGEVVQVGPLVDHVSVGQRITAMPLISCGRCNRCLSGRADLCEKRGSLGLHVDGAFAEYVLLNSTANVFTLPPQISAEEASLMEPMCVALTAVQVAECEPGQPAAVLGPGPIGLLVLEVLKASGVSPVMVAGTSSDELRLDLAKILGASSTVDVQRHDPIKAAKELDPHGLPYVFEATGNPDSVRQGLSMLKPGGRLVLIGIHPREASFNPTDLVRNRKTITGAYGYNPQTWSRAIRLLGQGIISVKELITHRIPLEEAQEGFKAAIRKEALKVVFLPA